MGSKKNEAMLDYRFDIELQHIFEVCGETPTVGSLVQEFRRVRPWLTGLIVDEPRLSSAVAPIAGLLEAGVRLTHSSLRGLPEHALGVDNLLCALAFSPHVQAEDWPLVRSRLQLEAINQYQPLMTSLAERIFEFATHTSRGEVCMFDSYRLFAACIKTEVEARAQDIEAQTLAHFSELIRSVPRARDTILVMAASERAPRGATAFIATGAPTWEFQRYSEQGRLMMSTAWRLAGARDEAYIDAIDLIAALVARADVHTWKLLEENGLTQLSLSESFWARLDEECYKALGLRLVPNSFDLQIEETPSENALDSMISRNENNQPERDSVFGGVDVLIVAALKLELDALREVEAGCIGEWVKVSGEYPYWRAIFEGDGGTIHVAATRLTEMGGVATALVAQQLSTLLEPRCLAMCGVCAGHPEDTDRGDVILADRVFQHDFGKQKVSGFQGDLWVHATARRWRYVAQELEGPAKGLRGYAEPREEAARWWFLDKLLPEKGTVHNPLRSVAMRRYFPDPRRAEMLERLEDELGDVALAGECYELTPAGTKQIQRHRVRHGTLVEACPYHIHVGPVASGNKIEADGEVWDRIANGGIRKVLGVEMEAATIGAVANEQGLPFAVAKAVMDHADAKKSDRFKRFAARSSAEVLMAFLRKVVSPPGRWHDAKTESNWDNPGILAQLESLEAEIAHRALAGEDTSKLSARLIDLRRVERGGPRLEKGLVLADRYKLGERVGKGGFATVWKAWDQERKQLVAVKVLHGQWFEDRSRRARFEAGTRRMNELNHPALVRVLELPREAQGFYFYVLPWFAKGDLRAALTKGRVDRETALRELARVLEGLEYAHAKGVVHRDIKPGNILIDEEGCAALSDFDLARAEGSTQGTRTGALGTFVYAAPEQLRDASRVDAKADIYGVGLTVMFVLAGIDPPPLVSRTEPEYFDKLGCGLGLKEVLQRAAAYEDRERNVSCAELVQALRSELAIMRATEKVCPAETADYPTPYFGDTVLIRLPKGITRDNFVEFTPTYARLTTAVASVSCVEGLGGALINDMAMTFYEEDTAKSMAVLRNESLEHMDYTGYVLTEEMVDATLRFYRATVDVPADDKNPAPTRALFQIRSGNGKVYAILFETQRDAWNALKETFIASADSMSFPAPNLGEAFASLREISHDLLNRSTAFGTGHYVVDQIRRAAPKDPRVRALFDRLHDAMLVTHETYATYASLFAICDGWVDRSLLSLYPEYLEFLDRAQGLADSMPNALVGYQLISSAARAAMQTSILQRLLECEPSSWPELELGPAEQPDRRLEYLSSADFVAKVRARLREWSEDCPIAIAELLSGPIERSGSQKVLDGVEDATIDAIGMFLYELCREELECRGCSCLGFNEHQHHTAAVIAHAQVPLRSPRAVASDDAAYAAIVPGRRGTTRDDAV